MDSSRRRLIAIFAWVSLAGIVFVTLSQSSFVYRLYYFLAPFLNHPSMRTYVVMEHFAAYGLVGMLLTVVYPRYVLRVCLFLFLLIVGLELMQTLTPDRHGTLRDALEKMIGGVVGVGLTSAALRCLDRADHAEVRGFHLP
jgi:VanZ family protein